MKKIIGITGGIGSGKTTVAKMIEEAGFPVYYSDLRAKNITNIDPEVQAEIKALLGEEAYDSNGVYNRKFVAEKVFENDDLLQKLNGIIHPAVRRDFESWAAAENSDIVFKETALLFELKLNESCYKSILVTADDSIRMKRVMDRDGKTYREVEAIMAKQMPEKEKVKLADFVIYNNDGLKNLEIQTNAVLEKITKKNPE